MQCQFFNSRTPPNSLLAKEGGRGGRLLSLLFSCLLSPSAPRGLLRKASEQFSKLKLDIPKLGLGNEEGFETDSKEEGFSIIYF